MRSRQVDWDNNGNTSKPLSGQWTKDSTYDLFIVTLTAGTISSDIELVTESNANPSSPTFTYAEFDNADDETNYSTPFYAGTQASTSNSGGYEFVSLAGTALPVTLTHFNVYKQNETDARLTWQTATELNNKGFYLERSTDGRSWEMIHFTESTTPGGNSNTLNNYEYVDANVYKSWTGISTYYYRIRQQDYNGKEEYVGGIKVVRFAGETEMVTINTYPNPAKDILHIQVSDGAAMNFTILDMSGRIVMRSVCNNEFPIDVSRLPSGTYRLTVYDIVRASLGSRTIAVAR